jgi:hypothetical protein
MTSLTDGISLTALIVSKFMRELLPNTAERDDLDLVMEGHALSCP